MRLDDYPQFVGRQGIAGQLLEAAQPDQGRNRVILLHGEGGIGKTRLLQRIAAQPFAASDRVCTPLIDMDDTSFHLPSAFGRTIAEALSREGFARYLESLDYYHDAERRQIDLKTIAAHLRQSEDVFIQNYNQFARHKPVVMLIDTFDEALDTTELWNFFKRLIAELTNTAFIFAGRRVDALEPRLKDAQAIVEKVPLVGLAGEEIDDFFAGIVEISDERKRKLALLTKGNPLLLCLALDCYRHGYWLDQIDQTSVAEIEKLVRENREEAQGLRYNFEKRLVVAYADIEPFPAFIRLLSYAPRRINEDIFKKLVHVPAGEGPDVWWEKLQQLPYLRRRASGEFFSVHDALRDLIFKHVVPPRDPSFAERKKINRKLIECYDKILAETTATLEDFEAKFAQEAEKEGGVTKPELSVAKLAQLATQRNALERQLWIVQAERLYYQLNANREVGCQEFIRKFDEASTQRQLTRRQRLTNEIKPLLAKGVIAVNDKAHFEISCRVARQEADDGRIEEALARIGALLKIYPAAAPKARLLELRGDCQVGLENGLHKAIADYKSALKVARKSKQLALDCARLEKLLGWSHRQLGDWKKASYWYEQAQNRLAHLQSNEPRTLREEASVCTNAAYVEAFRGDFTRAMELGLRGLEYRIVLKLPHEQAMSYSTLGEICRYHRNFSEALTYYNKAEDIFNGLDDRGWLGRLWQQEAICLLQMGADVPTALDKAKDAIVYCDRYYVLALPSAYNRAGRIMAASDDEARVWKSLDYFKKGVQIAQDIGDSWFYLANCVEALEMLQREYENSERNELLQAIEEIDGMIARQLKELPASMPTQTGQYLPHLLGRRKIALGTLAYQQGLRQHNNASLLTKALEHYLDGFKLINQGFFGSYDPMRLTHELRKLADRVIALPRRMALRWRDGFARAWKKRGTPSTLTQFADDVATIIDVKTKLSKVEPS